MLVFRVESALGNGPYVQFQNYDSRLQKRHSYSGSHPSMRDLFSPNEFWELINHVCGFVSIDKMLKWFHGHIGLLANNGYMVSTFKVNGPIRQDEYQCVFEKCNAKLLVRTPMKDFIVCTPKMYRLGNFSKVELV